MNLKKIKNIGKKAFTLVEMLVVIIIIGLLMKALLPKITGVQDNAKDKSTTTAVRDYLIAQKASNNSYPLHLDDFSKKPYISNKKNDGSDLSLASFKEANSVWGKGSWIMTYSGTDATEDETSDSGVFLNSVLSKLNSKDMSQLSWNDNSVVGIGFFGNLGKLLESGGADLANDNYIKVLKNQGFTYIDRTSTTNPAKAVWGGFVVWLDKTPGNGGVKITDENLIGANEEFKDTYANFAFVGDSLYFMSDLLDGEEDKRMLITHLLTAINSVNADTISELSTGN